jgi:hypothetical protein
MDSCRQRQQAQAVSVESRNGGAGRHRAIPAPSAREDVDGLPEGGRTGGEHGRRLQLIVGAREEDQIEGFVHRAHLDATPTPAVCAWDDSGAESFRDAATMRPMRLSRRSRTDRMTPQAIITSGSDKA